MISTLRKVVCLFLRADDWIWGRTSHRWPCCCPNLKLLFLETWKASLGEENECTVKHNFARYDWVRHRGGSRRTLVILMKRGMNDLWKYMIINKWVWLTHHSATNVSSVSAYRYCFVKAPHFSLGWWKRIFIVTNSRVVLFLNSKRMWTLLSVLLTLTRTDLAQFAAIIIPDLALSV